MFRIAAQDDASGLFRLDADEETQRVYPFDFRLDMAFAVEGVSLSMTATVMNRGSEDMPFSFGFHPAFAWPLPYGGKKEEHRVLFDRDEPAPLRKVGIEPGLITHQRDIGRASRRERVGQCVKISVVAEVIQHKKQL